MSITLERKYIMLTQDETTSLGIAIATGWAKEKAKKNREKLRGIDPESAVASEIFRLSGEVCKLRCEINDLKALVKAAADIVRRSESIKQ